jgi:hypothetical protein
MVRGSIDHPRLRGLESNEIIAMEMEKNRDAAKLIVLRERGQG